MTVNEIVWKGCKHQDPPCRECIELRITMALAEFSGSPGIFPDWVYESRQAIEHANRDIPWLPGMPARSTRR